VTPVPSTNTNDYSFSVSADFKKIVFIENSEAWVANADGTGRTQLTNTGGRVYVVAISPNGKKIVYDDESTGDSHFTIINPDGTGKLDLNATMPPGMNGCFSGSFSADSSLIVMSCYGSGYGIFTIKPDGTGLKTVSLQNSYLFLPNFTSDNKKILFIIQGTPSSLANGLRLKQISRIPRRLGTPQTSDNIASVNLDGTGAISIVPGATQFLVMNSNIYYTAFDSTSGHYQNFKAKMDGTGAMSISDGTTNDYVVGYGFGF
jgi:Tol biopolymer transport system component